MMVDQKDQMILILQFLGPIKLQTLDRYENGAIKYIELL